MPELTHRFRDCACPGTPHPKGDTVTYAERLPFDTLARVIGAIYERDGPPMIRNAFSIYLHEAPRSWNLVDDNGAPVPLTEEALDELPFPDQYEIADHADTLYQGVVLSPLVQRMAQSSKPGPTDESSPSPSPDSTERPARSRRSSEPSSDPSPTDSTTS